MDRSIAVLMIMPRISADTSKTLSKFRVTVAFLPYRGERVTVPGSC